MLQDARREYSAAQNQSNQNRTVSMEAPWQVLDSRKREQLVKLEQSELDLITGDNQHLSSFLLSFSQTFLTGALPVHPIWS